MAADRIKYEFYCTECKKYFDVKLNVSLNGNRRIHCPNCEHVHYRILTDGKITESRFPDNHESILVEDIWPMKACCRDFRKETILDSEDYAGPGGFMHRLWHELYSGAESV